MGDSALRVRRYCDLGLLHGEDNGVGLEIRNERQQSEHKRVDSAGARVGKGNGALVGRDGQEERHRLAKMLARELRDVQLRRVAGRLQRDVAGKPLFDRTQDRSDLGGVGFHVEPA